MANAKKTKALDTMIDGIYDIRNEIRALNKQVDELKTQKEEMELKLIDMMDAVGTDQSRSSVATATISETVVPQVTDWDAFWKFIMRNKATYLVERRPAAVAFRETLEQRKGRAIPGVSSFTKRTVGIRVRSTN